MKPEITKEILIEELVNNYRFSVKYLMQQGIRCIMCGEPIWGTLEEAAKEKDFTDEDIQRFVDEMKELAKNENDGGEENGQKVEVKKIN
jgi:methionine synthase II (cobalamin-independent)